MDPSISSVCGIYRSNVWTPQAARHAFEVDGLHGMAKTAQSAWREFSWMLYWV